MVYLGSIPDNGVKITLDQRTFKVLASETRIGILKRLDKSQMTVSDLARTLGMSKATLFEHLVKLIEIGLIKKIEDNRKWVYYKLTWKGKNILHPERTKIAIVLSIIIVSFIILGYLIMLNSGIDLFNQTSNEQDTNAPEIEFLKVDDITEKTNAPSEVIIKIYDEKAIDESSLTIEYTISNNYYENIEFLAGWQKLQGTVDDDKIYLMLPTINWNLNSGKYLYIQCSVKDRTGNFAQKVYIEYIEQIYEDSLDLSVVISDVEFEINSKAFQIRGLQTIPLTIKVHNTGAFDVHNVEVSIFSRDPDTNDDGIIDDFNTLIGTRNIDLIESRDLKIVEIEIELNLSKSRHFWVTVDPKNIINESNELNNLVNVNLDSDSSISIIPEFPMQLGLFIAVSIILMYGIFRKRSN